MAVSIAVSVDDSGVRQMLRDALAKTGNLTRPMSELGLWMVRDAGRRLRARTARSDDSTGALRSSLTFRAAPDSVTIGSNLQYAAVQQLGHEGIKAKPPLKRIAIPLLPHLRRRHIWPRDLPDGTLRLVVSKAGNVVLLGPASGTTAGHPLARPRKTHRQSEMPAAKMVPWYVLVPQSKIPARPYLVFEAEAEAFLQRRLIKHLGLTN